MSLSPQDIARIANLARLELSEDESARILVQTNAFFDIVEKMRAVDDIASEPNQRQANQKSAPAVENGLFLVPKVIE